MKLDLEYDLAHYRTLKMQDGMGSLTSLKEVASGTLGGALQAIVGHPLDLIKVKMQGNPTLNPTIVHSVNNVLKNDGIFGFYKGLSAPLLSCGVTNAAMFCLYGTAKRAVASVSGNNVSDLSLPEICIASWLYTPFYCLVFCPVEIVKVKLQYNSFFSKPLDVVKSVGIRGIYKGYVPTLGYLWIGAPAYFCSYEAAKSGLIDNHILDEKSNLVGLISGFFAGVCFWSANFPIDMIKTRMQIDQSSTIQNPWNVGRSIIQNEGGIRALYRGFLPCLLRSGPANAVAFGGFEFGMRILN